MNFDDIRKSIVGIRAHIPEDAFTADTLGTERDGSGVVIRQNGLVLTIGYLITEAEEVWLDCHDGRSVQAHPLVYDQETGFGLLQALEPLDLPALKLAESGLARIGDEATIIDGTGRAVDAAIVGKQEFAGYWEYLLDEAFFTAPAHPFWGGAAMVDEDGRLLGIGSLHLQMAQKGEGIDINMIVPIDLAKPILKSVLSSGTYDRQARPWIGAFSAERNGEVVVMSVADGGPAAKAGVRSGDVIAEIRDAEIDGLADFYRKVWKSGPAGSDITVRIVRNGLDQWLRIKSADRTSFLKRPQLQ